MSKLKHSHTKKQIRKYGTHDEINLIRQNKKENIETIRELIRNEKYQLVEYSIDNYIEKYGIDCYLLHEKARYKASINEIEEAKKIYIKIIDDDSENKYYSMYELGKLESNTGNFDLAISYFEKIISSNHRDKCHALLETTKCLNLLGENEKAEEYLNIIIKNNMENKYLAMEQMVIVALDQNKIREANEYIGMVKDHLEDANYKYLKGILAFKVKKLYEAKDIFEEILTNEIHFRTKTLLSLANVLYDLELYEEAINCLENIREDTGFYYPESIKKTVHCYIRLGLYDKAEETINLLNTDNDRYINEQHFLYGRLYQMNLNYFLAYSHYDKVEIKNPGLYLDSLYNKICILIKLKKYNEAYELITEIKENDSKGRYTDRINSMELLLSKKLNLNLDLKEKRYTDFLINNYDRDMVLEHIEKHKYEDFKNDRHTVFSENIDVEKLYDKVLININEENFYYNDFVDVYIIPYQNVGINNGKMMNFVKAVTLPNSKDIITIFPYNKLSSNENKKVKEKSRIEKFNLKYGIK